MKIDIAKVEKMLKALTVKQIADRLDITKDSLQYHLKMAGTDILQIKDDYAREVLSDLSGKYTYKEMSKITGFSSRKIDNYAAIGIVTSKMKSRGSTKR